MIGKVYDCPKCKAVGYDAFGNRCTMCHTLRKVEDGGPSAVAGDTNLKASPYMGRSGYFSVINLRTHDKN